MSSADQYRTHLRSASGDFDLAPDIDPWTIPILGVALVLILFLVVPIVHLTTGVHLLALVGVALAGYVAALVAIDRAVAGLIAAVCVLATVNADVPLVSSASPRLSLDIFIADPFIALFLTLTVWWTYTGQIDRPRGLAVVGLAFAWAGWAALAAVFGAGPSTITALVFAIDQARFAVYLFAGLALARCIPLRVGVLTVAIAGVAHAFVAVGQAINGRPFGISALGENVTVQDHSLTVAGLDIGVGAHLGGLAGGSAALATTTLLSLAVCLYYLRRGGTRQRALATLGTAPILVTITLARSDTAVLCAVGVIAAIGAVEGWGRLSPRSRAAITGYRTRLALAGLVVGMGGLLVAWWVGVETLLGALPLIDGGSFDSRVDKYVAGVAAAREHPIFGLGGGGNFELVAEAYGASDAVALHSFVFEFLAGTGVVGLHLSVVGAVVWYGVVALERPGADTAIVAVICVWIGAFLVMSSLNLLWSGQTSYSVFWLVAGMVVGVARSRPTYRRIARKTTSTGTARCAA